MGTFVITGGASGIGKAIADKLRDDGHNCLSLDLQTADIVADLSSPAGRQQAAKDIEAATAGELSGLVTSAGVGSHLPDMGLITEVNYFGTVELVEALRPLLARNRASVLLVSSNSAPMPTNDDFVDRLLDGDREAARALAESMHGQQVYSGAKQAVTRWMRRHTVACAEAGIRINAIGPGYTRTPLSLAAEDHPQYGEAIKQFIATIPIGRPGQPEDMAEAASFLLSERASFICGAMLYVDGGHDAMMRPDAL